MKILSLTQFKKQFDVGYHAIMRVYKDEFFTDNLEQAGTEIMPYMLDGKRIRPYIIACMAPEGDNAMHAGYAIELFHAMALIHDDIIDESALRRKSQTPHHVLKKYTHENMHIGESLSLLWGDYIYAQSMHYVSLLPEHARAYFLEMYNQTVIGQVHDVMNSITALEKIPHDDVQRVHDAKTGYYTFVYPLLIGNALQNADKRVDTDLLMRLGLSLGRLFQMRDDIIDMLPTSNKEQWKDIREGTASWVVMWLRDTHPEIYTEIESLHAEAIFDEEKFNSITHQLETLPWQEIFTAHTKEHSNTILEIIESTSAFTKDQQAQLRGLHDRFLTLV